MEKKTAPIDEFERLRRFAEYHQGQFSLGMVRVNDPRKRNEIVQNLGQSLKQNGIQLFHLDLSNRHPVNLREALNASAEGRRILQSPRKTALAITGMEHLIETTTPTGRPAFAAALNAERDLLRNGLPMPVLLFMTDLAMDRLDINAPDFFDWYSATFHFLPHGLSAARSETAVAGLPHQPPTTSLKQRQKLEMLEKARKELASQPKPSLILPNILMEIGEIYASLPGFADRQLATSYLKQAAQLYTEMEQTLKQAEAVARLAEVYYWIDNYDQSAIHYAQAIELYQAEKHAKEQAACLQKKGDVHLQLGELPTADECYQQALDIYRELGNLSGIAACIRSRGDFARLIGDYTLAENRYRSAAPIFKRAQDPLGIANCIQSMGDILLQQGEYRRAQLRYQEALPQYIQIENALGQADCLQGLGHALRLQGDLLSARKYYGKALDSYRALGHRLGEASCIESIADLCRRLEDYAGSEREYMEALSIYRALHNRLGEANTFYGLGEMFLRKDERDTALQFILRAEAIYKKSGAQLGQANTLVAQGQINLLDGKLDQAIEMLDQANQLYLKIGDRYSIAAQTGNYGWLMQRIEQPTLAKHYFLRSAELFTALGLEEQTERHLQAANDRPIPPKKNSITQQR
jgi:tetratricopeptide (TPR) repeat protein